MTEKKVFSGIGWLFAMYGWALFLPMFIYNLYYEIWIGSHFIYFYRTWLNSLIAITTVALIIQYIKKIMNITTEKDVNKTLKEELKEEELKNEK